MLKFVTVDKTMPPKRDAAARRTDFREIYPRFSSERASEQAGRCSQCGVPFCQVSCPLQNNIPDWLKLTAEGRLEEAYEASSATNTFPEICGRICPQDRLCEGNCVIEKAGHGTVTIGAVERFITETAWENGWIQPRRPRRELASSVGIIGAGPAGLAAADQLRRKGHQVHVYDRYDRAGGLLVYGIPNFKLEKEVVARRVDLLRESGAQFHLGFEVGKDATLDELRRRHDAVLIACGVYKKRALHVPGVQLGNIVQALDYLTASNKKGLGDTVPAFESGALDARGKRVTVIGGGDTAMDCVRTAVRQGAKSVVCLYRRDRANMPGSKAEVLHAEEEGVELVWLALPESFAGDSRGAVAAVRAARIHLSVPDASGRQTPRVIEGSGLEVPTDLVIEALGFEPEDIPPMFGAKDLAVTKSGTLVIDPRTKMTSLSGVFAAGDIVRGASLVVWAIKDGRDAAEQMDLHIRASAEARAAEARAAAE
jgi:glutamate synthase (NADPH/NADH) small chain